MDYFFKEGHDLSKKFILLHGTGGDENSLKKLAYFFDSDATILSFRGTIEEDGMKRFFKRKSLNQFDYESLEKESDRLLNKIYMISQQERIAVEEWTILGYSNGANIAAHILLERESLLQQAILFHPMSLGVDTQSFPITAKKVWLSIGKNDPIVPEKSAVALAKQFKSRGAQVDMFYTESGHQVIMDELAAAKQWLTFL
ncbi:alpha/beta hydrolase [Enterococcus sp. LJL99]